MLNCWEIIMKNSLLIFHSATYRILWNGPITLTTYDYSPWDTIISWSFSVMWRFMIYMYKLISKKSEYYFFKSSIRFCCSTRGGEWSSEKWESQQILSKSRNLTEPTNGSRSLRFCACRSHICFSIKTLHFLVLGSDFKMPVSASLRVSDLPFATPSTEYHKLCCCQENHCMLIGF